MTLQDAGMLFLMLFPFSLVSVAAVAMIRRRMKNKTPKLELASPASSNDAPTKVYVDGLNRTHFPKEKPKPRKKRKASRGKRK